MIASKILSLSMSYGFRIICLYTPSSFQSFLLLTFYFPHLLFSFSSFFLSLTLSFPLSFSPSLALFLLLCHTHTDTLSHTHTHTHTHTHHLFSSGYLGIYGLRVPSRCFFRKPVHGLTLLDLDYDVYSGVRGYRPF